MDFVQTTLDGEQVKIINVTGSDKNTTIAYIDSSNNLKVKVKPVSWEDFSSVQNKSLSTGSYEITSNVNSFSDVSQGTGLMCGIWGSSSDRRCSTSEVNLLLETSSTNGSVEYTDGWWRHMISKYNCHFNLVWNGAVAGTVWEQCATKITADLSGTNMPHINYAFVRPGANNLTSGGTAESIKSSIRDVVENQLLSRGIKVVLITSHVTSGEDSTIEYDRLGDFFDELSLEYPGLVMHANTYKQFGVGVPTPERYTLDGIHLNETGTSIAINAFEKVVNNFARPPKSLDPYDFGEVVMEIDPHKPSGWQFASAVLLSGTPDIYKKKRLGLSATANGGRLLQSAFSPGKSLSAGDLCRLWCDVTCLSGSSTSTIYAAGVYLRTSAGVTDSKRFGSYGSGANIGPMNGDWIRGLSRIFTIPASLLSGTQLAVTAGAGINSILFGKCALIRVKKANS